MLFDPLTPKKLDLLHELVPSLSVGLLVNPKNPNNVSHKEHAELAAKSLGFSLTILTASSGEEIASAFEQARQKAIGAVLVGDDPLFDVQSPRLVESAARSKIPTMYYVRDFVDAGGLLSYGPSFDEMSFQVGIYTGRILKGAKPADLPIQQPTKFELVINLKSAKAFRHHGAADHARACRRGNRMKRREFIAGLAGTMVAPMLQSAPLWAQSSELTRRIGVLMARNESDPEGQKQVAGLRQGLRDLGWKLGQSLQVDYRWSVGDFIKALAAARDLVALNPDLLVARWRRWVGRN